MRLPGYGMVAIAALLCAAALTLAACASHPVVQIAGDSCATRYPILLVHGVGYRDDLSLPYWGRIAERLRENGARVFLSGGESFAPIEVNADILDQRLAEVLRETRAEKANLIGHSKGGLEARYLISTLGRGGQVASLTTFNTPHRGSPIADYLVELNPDTAQGIAEVVDFLATELLGERAADARLVATQLTAGACAAFNAANPDDSRVYYQSYASRIGAGYPVRPFVVAYQYILSRDGENDGLVSVASARWGSFRGIVAAAEGVSLSHADMCDAPGLSNRKSRFDVPGFYVSMVSELRRRGY